MTDTQATGHELRPLTEEDNYSKEDNNSEEPRDACGNLRRVLVAALLWVMTFFVSSAYSLVGSFFPIEVLSYAGRIDAVDGGTVTYDDA